MEQFQPKHEEKVKALSVDDDCFYIDLECGLRLSGPRLIAVPLSEAENLAAPRNAALRCTGDAEATYACLGKRPNCGQCLEEAQEIIEEERAAASCEVFAL